MKLILLRNFETQGIFDTVCFIIDKAFLLEESLVKMHLRSSAWRAASTTEVRRKRLLLKAPLR